MKRDLTEQLDNWISRSKTWSEWAEALRHWLDKIFLNSPLRPLKNVLNGTRMI